MSERVRIGVDDAELDEVMARMDAALRMKQALVGGAGLLTPMLPAKVKADVDQILLEAGGLDAVLLNIEQAKIGLAEVADDAEGLNLPQIDRATRMILLRIPGLREAMRLLYAVKMMQRTLKLGELRGPVTAAIAAALYASMALQSLEQRQNQLEAKMKELERITTMRYITMDEALKGYDRRSEKYRATVAP